MLILTFFLGLIEIKIFLNYYGADLNGLLQSSKEIFGYLIIIESGLSAAYIYRMYKPKKNNDVVQINKLYNGFIINMKQVVLKMLIVALPIILLYPFILYKNQLSYFRVFLLLVLVALRFILPFLFIVVPKQMVILSEKRYIVELIEGLRTISTFIVEFILVVYFKFSLDLVLFASLLFILVSGTTFKLIMNKMYSGLLYRSNEIDTSPKEMSKDLLIHNVSGIVINNSSSLILSVLVPLSTVFIYSSYNRILNQVSQLFQKILEGASATFGIKMSDKDHDIFPLFRKIQLGVMFFTSFTSIVFIVEINNFINLWIGNEYQLSRNIVLIMGLSLFTNLSLLSIYLIRNAAGLYKESKNFTILQAALNTILSIVLVYWLGTLGAVIAIFISRILIALPFNYNLVNRYILKVKKIAIFEFIYQSLFIIGASYLILNIFNFESLYTNISPITNFIIGVIITSSITLLLIIFVFLLIKEYRLFIKSIVKVTLRKLVIRK